MKYKKGDCRAHGLLSSKPLTRRHLGKKQGYTEPATGPNRHERRREKAVSRYRLAIKGKAGAKLIRRLFRRVGLQDAIMLMHGYNRGVKRHPGYPTMGNYDKTGGKLASPRK